MVRQRTATGLERVTNPERRRLLDSIARQENTCTSDLQHQCAMNLERENPETGVLDTVRPQMTEGLTATSALAVEGADQFGRTADALRAPLTQFLQSAVKTDDADRRRFKRIDGNGATATVRVQGRAPMRPTIENISRGGVAVGTEVLMELPGSASPVAARTVRSGGKLVVPTFRQDGAVLRRVDASRDHSAAQAVSRASA